MLTSENLILHRRLYSDAVQNAIKANEALRLSKANPNKTYVSLIIYSTLNGEATYNDIFSYQGSFIDHIQFQSAIQTEMDFYLGRLRENEQPCWLVFYDKGRDYATQPQCFEFYFKPLGQHEVREHNRRTANNEKWTEQRLIGERRSEQEKLAASNINCIFTMEDAEDGELFIVLPDAVDSHHDSSPKWLPRMGAQSRRAGSQEQHCQ